MTGFEITDHYDDLAQVCNRDTELGECAYQWIQSIAEWIEIDWMRRIP